MDNNSEKEFFEDFDLDEDVKVEMIHFEMYNEFKNLEIEIPDDIKI